MKLKELLKVANPAMQITLIDSKTSEELGTKKAFEINGTALNDEVKIVIAVDNKLNVYI